MDTLSLRVAFGVVSLTMLVLFYVATYRSTRARYAAWWCVSVALFLVGSLVFLLDDTAEGIWSVPVGNALVSGGAVSVWAGSASLRGRVPRGWQLVAPPALVALVTVIGNPAADEWAGGWAFLGVMALGMGLSARELWLLGRERESMPSSTYGVAVRSMATISTLVAVYYAGRLVAFLAVGPDGGVFKTVFGSQVTTLAVTVLLVTVSFNMSVISNEQQTSDLRRRATHDGLTGLLNRQEFIRLARQELTAARRTPTTLVVADLDHFKSVNDRFGHVVGDETLRVFGEACREVLGPHDLVGRLGGEEFLLLLPGSTSASAERVVAAISRRFAAEGSMGDDWVPTVSYGIAAVAPDGDVGTAIEHADAALYRAKAAGRNRAVRYGADGESLVLLARGARRD